LKNKHPKHYRVYNLSGRKYDYSKFDHQVYEYQWEDHHSPPIHLLFEICQKIDQFLKGLAGCPFIKNKAFLENVKNVIVVHCLAGKGRTGTIICCYMMYCGRMKTPEKALEYYAKKRFFNVPQKRIFNYYLFII
jgi:phosphatidylinositol-3,4,5-trisphosphate 3-phosphatase/dual-specificity protein phosphatase PTEN